MTDQPQFGVEHRFTYGWDDAGWAVEEDGVRRRWTFDTKAEAQAEIDELCAISEMDYDPGDFRIVRLPLKEVVRCL